MNLIIFDFRIQAVYCVFTIIFFSYITKKKSKVMNPNNNQQAKSDERQDSRQAQVSKKEDQGSDVITCEKCTKIFMNEAAYLTHVKTKHSESERQQKEVSEVVEVNEDSKVDRIMEKKPVKKAQVKNRIIEIQQNELQDTIYAFLGELGQKNAQPVNNRSQFILHSQNQRLTGQTNYSLNKVVRTPYEQPIKASENLPNEEIQKSPYKEFLLMLKQQLKQLEDKVEAERQIWQLRDPMAPEEETQDEFSLMDIRKLIINYPKRKLTLKHPFFSIYLLWIARICKPPAFKQFFLVLGSYLAKFMSVPQNKKLNEDNCYELWKNYFKNNENNLVDKQVFDKMEICDQKNGRKFIEYFVEWTEKFKAMII